MEEGREKDGRERTTLALESDPQKSRGMTSRTTLRTNDLTCREGKVSSMSSDPPHSPQTSTRERNKKTYLIRRTTVIRKRRLGPHLGPRLLRPMGKDLGPMRDLDGDFGPRELRARFGSDVLLEGRLEVQLNTVVLITCEIGAQARGKGLLTLDTGMGRPSGTGMGPLGSTSQG